MFMFLFLFYFTRVVPRRIYLGASNKLLSLEINLVNTVEIKDGCFCRHANERKVGLPSAPTFLNAKLSTAIDRLLLHRKF